MRGALRPFLMAAATLATAVAVVSNPILPTLPDVAIPAMFPAVALPPAAKPTPAVGGATRVPATPPIAQVAATLVEGAAVGGQAVTAAAKTVGTPLSTEMSAAIVRAAQTGSVSAARGALKQPLFQAAQSDSLAGSGDRSRSPVNSVIRLSAGSTHLTPLPAAAVHAPPPPMAAVPVEPSSKVTVHAPATRPDDPVVPRQRH